MDWWKERSRLDIRVFGSFSPDNRTTLEALIDALQTRGYTRCSRVDLPIRGETPKELEQIAQVCTQEAKTSQIAIFILFHGDDEPNQSAIMELSGRLYLMERDTGRTPSPQNTIVLAEDGVPIRGLLADHLQAQEIGLPDHWETEEELVELAAGALLSASGSHGG